MMIKAVISDENQKELLGYTSEHYNFEQLYEFVDLYQQFSELKN